MQNPSVILLDAGQIHRHHSLQWRDARDFIVSSLLGGEDWGDLSGETLMDVGCGAGQNSTRLFLDSFPGLERIVATDASPDMIHMARECSPSPKVDYFVADIQNEEANKRWFGSMKRIISIHCFHWLQNQVQAFRNIYNVLKPGGHAALLFVLNAPNFVVHKNLQNGKWKDWLKEASCGTPISQTKQYEESYYVNLLKSIGFEVNVCKAEIINFPFESDEKFKGFLTSVCPLMEHIPDHLKDEFSEDLLNGMLECCGRLEDGRPNFHCTNIRIILRKPC